ncbi:uncharacterized protein LOC106066613 isoform X2 [Biomphalaria glabrata]|uniref:Uncharacterized protein LOC106066613 isoform X2 n=1 Tax=Biomphalaria glabrata TaxID=6526 RepID=A0A9W3AJ15_BIOGL|nr:uncharacterized protein LOC106066613 isoform X2 [Biomphalaria glabrata]
MDSEDELSLLSPDWEEDFCEAGVHVGRAPQLSFRTDFCIRDTPPAGRLPRVAFVDVGPEDDDSCSYKKTGKTLTAGIIKNSSTRTCDVTSLLPSKSAVSHRSNETTQYEIPSCLKKVAAQCPDQSHTSSAFYSPCVPLSGAFQTNSSEMSFPQISISCDDTSQGIELNTLSFQAPSHESSYYISAPKGCSTPIPPSKSSMCSNESLKFHRTSFQDDENSPNIMDSYNYRSDQVSESNINRCGQNKSDISDDNENANKCGSQQKPCRQQIRTMYPKIFPQPCCAIGLHPSFNRDRRLPDYVTIDQCYSGDDDREASTIRIVANFNTGPQQDSRHGEHRHGQQGQGQAPKRGQPEVLSRKERISLRRGVMMRQMSMNPAHEQEMHLLSEMRFADNNAQQSSEHYQPVVSSDTWEGGQGANRRLSNCSFARAAVHPPPTQALVTVDSRDEVSGTDSGGSMAGNVSSGGSVAGNISSGDDSEKWRGSVQGSHGSPSGARIKMKDLGLSHATSAMRFRLTFDETADAAANNNIELPFDVAPQSLTTKRPSCICGEPELPPSDSFPPLENYRDTASVSQTGNGVNSFSRHNTSTDPLITTTYSSNTDSYPIIVTPNSPMTDLQNPDTAMEYIGTNGSQINFSDFQPVTAYENSSSNRVQTQMDSGQNYLEGSHPKVMICVSNSQQSFIPFTCDSPTQERNDDDQFQLNEFLTHHNNNKINHFIKDGVPVSYDGMSPVEYAFSNQHYHHSDCCGELSNGGVPLEELRLLSHQDGHASALLQHQDTVSAPPIQDLYRYHVFFSHCPEDREWVEHMVAHLEAPPFNYTCAYASLQDEADPGTLQQRILCAAMLSERVVLVLSKRYVEETWFSFEKTLKQLTQMSLHNQRIMGVLLEDCDIPESLGELYFLDSSDPDFFLVFTKRLKTSRIPRSSASVSSDLGQTALTPANVTNGKILTFCRLQVKVGWDSYLTPADGPDLDIPPSLSAHGIGMEKTEFGEIVTKVSGIIRGTNKLPWLLSAQPLAALLLAGTLWLPAFIAVLVVHVDDDSGNVT